MTDEIKEVQEPAVDAAAQTEATAAEKQAAELNISDLVAIKSIIEVATQRGSFKANELEAIGRTYNRLNVFLESVSKKEG
jgi:hypothetical protein